MSAVGTMYALHSLNARNDITREHNFKENIIQTCLGERLTKVVVIMRMKVIFLHVGFHAKIRCNLNDISYLSEAQKNDYT